MTEFNNMLLLQSVFLPIILAPIVYLLGKKIGKNVGWITFLILLYSTILMLYSSSLSDVYLELYDWHPIGNFGLQGDGLSLPFALMIAILSVCLSVYSISYMNHRIRQTTSNTNIVNKKFGLYFSLYLIYFSGMLGTVLATNLIQFYVFFELMLIPSYFLIAEFGYGDKARISLMYFIWTHIGALLLLSGILAIGMLGGSFDISSINELNIPFNIRIWLAAAIIIGLFVKLAAFGVHIWLPHAHAEAPTPISALLSPVMIGIGGYAILRIILFILPSVYLSTTLFVSIWGLITMIYGAIMAFSQDDIKRLLAYSSISQMGYIIFGIGSAYYLGITGSVFQYVSHGTAKGILFMVAGTIIMKSNGIRSISQMGGLSKKLPITTIAALIGFMTLFGVPPLNGFQSEWILFYGAFAGSISLNSDARLILTGVALLSSTLTAGYALLTMKRVFFGKLPDNLSHIKENDLCLLIPIIFLVILTIFLGIYPNIVLDRLIPTISEIFSIGV